MILAVYEEDLENPLWPPLGGYGMDPQCVVLRRTYEDTQGRSTPYLIYLDHVNSDIVLAVRGFSFAQSSDYAMMLDNTLGKKAYDGGFVHNGLLKAAEWVLESECKVLTELLGKYPKYTLTVAGHSLGSGVAAMLALLFVQKREMLGCIERKRVRCYAIAPARCMSLSLALRYADVINSVVLQDDFLPRVPTPLEDIFSLLFCLPCILCFRCVKDTFASDYAKITDPRRLYAPGRLYHIVERKAFRCGRYPPVVRTAIPVDGRFDGVVLSCNATSDHSIIWIEKEAQEALNCKQQQNVIENAKIFNKAQSISRRRYQDLNYLC